MIYVDRSRVAVPPALLSPRVQSERERIQKVLKSSEEHLKQLRITTDVRHLAEVKPALLDLFHGKCAYCESDIDHSGFLDIEHYRPRQGAADLAGTKAQHHYVWLSYEWDNLLISCTPCTSVRGKGSGLFFPVLGERAPILASVDECRQVEQPLLIDPCFDRPEQHLQFLANGQCVATTDRGRATIEVHDLNRGLLVEARHETWARVESLMRLMPSAGVSVAPQLRQLVSGEQPYTATARASFAESMRALDQSARDRLAQQAFANVEEPVQTQIQEAVRGPSPESLTPPPGAPVGDANVASFAPAPSPSKVELPPLVHALIRKVDIHNFKAIEDLALDIADAPREDTSVAAATVFLGENASGKSTILEAITLTLLGTDAIQSLGLDAHDFVRRTDWDAPAEEAESADVAVYFSGADDPVRLHIDAKTRSFTGNAQPSTIVLAYGPRRFFAEKGRQTPLSGQAEQVRTMFDPLAIIENPSRWLMDAPQDDFDAAVRALRQLLLLPDEALVTRDAMNPSGGRKEIMFEVQGDIAPLNRMSEGYKTIVAMAVDVMREMLEFWPDLEDAKGVVLVDELETHLHPRWKMRIMQRLRRAFPQVQFIATTHDPLCLRGLYDGEAQVMQRDRDHRIERVRGLPNLRGLSVEQLLTSEFFGLFSTEDPRLEEEVARYTALAAKRDRTPEDDQVLAQQREALRDTMTVGAQPAAQLVHEAATEYLAERRQASAEERPALKRAAIEKVINLWKSIDTGDAG